jgi:hypothetical protein
MMGPESQPFSQCGHCRTIAGDHIARISRSHDGNGSGNGGFPGSAILGSILPLGWELRRVKIG